MPIETIGQLLCELASERGAFETSDLEKMREIVESEENVTAKVLQAMLTENTGRHVLDSGGAYGRNWERNQNVKWQNIDRYTFDGSVIILQVYPLLLEELEYDFELDLKFHEFAQSDGQKNSNWYNNMSDFCSLHKGSTCNTYNGDTNLSQVLQYGIGSDEEGEFIILQIHGGCDVRGGYSTPHAFRTENGYITDAEWIIRCKCGFSASSDDGYSAYVDESPFSVRVHLSHIRKEEDLIINYEGSHNSNIVCPCCGRFIEMQGNEYSTELTADIAFEHVKKFWCKALKELGYREVNKKAKEILKDHPLFKNSLYRLVFKNKILLASFHKIPEYC